MRRRRRICIWAPARERPAGSRLRASSAAGGPRGVPARERPVGARLRASSAAGGPRGVTTRAAACGGAAASLLGGRGPAGEDTPSQAEDLNPYLAPKYVSLSFSSFGCGALYGLCQIPSYPNLTPQLICGLHNVTMHADAETYEVYAQMTLQPLNLDFSQHPPCQELMAKDLHANGVRRNQTLLEYSPAPIAKRHTQFVLETKDGTVLRIHGSHSHNVLRTFCNGYSTTTRRAEFHGSGLIVSFRTIYRTEGLLGFYRGNGASVARIVPYAALHYMAYGEYCQWIILGFPNVEQGPVLDLVAGSIAGGTAVICTYPLDLVRTKLANQVPNYSNLMPQLICELHNVTMHADAETYEVYAQMPLQPLNLDFSQRPPCQELRYILDWRYVKVVWDESTAGERQPRVSLWEIEPLKTFPMYPSPFPLGLKRPWSTGLPSLHGGKEDLANSLMWLRDNPNPEQASPTMLQFQQPQNTSPSQILLQAHAQFQQQPYLQNISESPIQAQGQSESLKQLIQRQLQHQESEQQQQSQCLLVPQHQQMQQQNMCDHMSKVQFIVMLGGRSLSKQQVLEDTTVKELIESCCHEIGIRETKGLYGVLCGKILSDEKLLCHYPIRRDSTIDLRSRLRGGQQLETLTTRFSKPDADLFYSVALPYPLRNRFILDKDNKTSKSVWKLKLHTRFCLKQVLLFFTGQHRAGNCFNGAFEKDDILFGNGRAYLRDGIAVSNFSGQGCKLDFNKLSTILKELKTSDGYYTPYFHHLLDYLERCPFGEDSKSDLAISFLINHPAIEYFGDRMKQIMLVDAVLFRVLTNPTTPMDHITRITDALGEFHQWWDLLEYCPAMTKVLDWDSYVDSGGAVVYSARYTNDPAGGFHYSNNFFKHARKKLGLEEIEAAHSVNAPDLLPEVLENITSYAIDPKNASYAIDPKNAGFAKQFKILLDLIQNDLADPHSEHSQDN